MHNLGLALPQRFVRELVAQVADASGGRMKGERLFYRTLTDTEVDIKPKAEAAPGDAQEGDANVNAEASAVVADENGIKAEDGAQAQPEAAAVEEGSAA